MTQADEQGSAPWAADRGISRIVTPARLFWIGLLLSTWALSTWSFPLYKLFDARWIIRYPAELQVPFDTWITAAVNWLIEDVSFVWFTFQDLTRAITAAIRIPYDLVRALLIDGVVSGRGQQAVEVAPPLSWIAVIGIMTALGYYAKDRGLALLVGASFAYLAVFGQWESAMITMASVLIAVPIGVLGGAALGIAAYRTPRFDRMLRPVLDLMQTIPIFAYLVPILVLFGFGPISALIATVVYAMPPMVRISTLALRAVPEDVVEAGQMIGCSRRQLLWKVLIPTAMPTFMVGVNQVIMLSLNMVIIASMIGAGGLGYDVLTALRRLDIGGGIEAGLAIVVIAVALDRLSQALAVPRGRRQTDTKHPFHVRHPILTAMVVFTLITTAASVALPFFREYPASLTITTGTFWAVMMEWINTNFFDAIEAVKSALLTYLLLPVRGFFVGIPWAWGVIAVGLAAGRLGGARFGIIAALMTFSVAAVGLWREAMTTVYLSSISVLIASLIGIPLGIWAGRSARANSVIGTLIDTLQTLPSFVYLIPVVMLFRVGDFSAMIAVVLYAVVPAVRYAAHGIRSIDQEMLEAGRVSGCTPRQMLWRIQLPLAAPSMLLGLNQTIMLALSMLVITALVGTRDLGQEVYIALTQANIGQGIVAGLSIAFIAIIADRSVSALARSTQLRLGLE